MSYDNIMEELQKEREKLEKERQELEKERQEFNRRKQELDRLEKELLISQIDIKTINLDRFKPLFKNTLDLNYELGFNLCMDEKDNISFEVSKGNNTDLTVTMPYNKVVSIHTHPNHPNEERRSYKFYPPSHLDYIESIWGYFKNTAIDIVIEKSGMWIYIPTQDMIRQITERQPDIYQLLKDDFQEGEIKKEVIVNDNLYKLVNAVQHNSNINNLNLIKNKISLDEYIQDFKNLVSQNIEIGFEVEFIPWDKPFIFSIALSHLRKLVFTQIQERGLNVFDENDQDTINNIAEHTPPNRILRKL